ncbi:MAG: LapA family protein [Moraxellaceae bacterium]|nr:LapA family protein [Moraxellaceae bacterium]
MAWLRKTFFIVSALLLLLSGLWLVVVNDQTVSLNLLFFAADQVNSGVVVLVSFAVGAAVGLFAGFNLFALFKLNAKLYWLKREVRQLQDALGKNPR